MVLQQLNYLKTLPGSPQAPMAAAIHEVEAARDALAKADPTHLPTGEFFHAPASWWLSLAHYDAIEAAHALHVPLLVLQGMADFQVPPAQDFAAWKRAFAGNPHVTLHSYPGLSHLFMPSGKPPSPADYARPAQVDSKVIGDIAAWIARQPAAASR